MGKGTRRKPERYLIREVKPGDLDGLYRLSKHLDSVNFPHNKAALRSMIARARKSMGGSTLDPAQREYVFVLQGADSGQILGTSMIIGQHGHLDGPHVYFDVFKDERYSTTLNRHFTHTTLRLGFDYQGPTEIGALVLDPKFRSLGLGRPLSFVRFLFIAMYRKWFRDEVLAELMPPLTDEGRSHLWEHVGKRFTGLTYPEADKLSQKNKEFIIALFPQAIHATLLPDEVAALIGQVGEDTKGVRRMLEKVGFRYSQRIDPFDGGPHFEAPTDDVTTVAQTRKLPVGRRSVHEVDETSVLNQENIRGLRRVLVAIGKPKPPLKFCATLAAARIESDEVVLSEETRALLKLRRGQPVHVTEV